MISCLCFSLVVEHNKKVRLNAFVFLGVEHDKKYDLLPLFCWNARGA